MYKYNNYNNIIEFIIIIKFNKRIAIMAINY